MKIILEDLSFGFGKNPLFDHLNLELEEPGPVTILGPSGCGKTTLLRLMAGLLLPLAGTLRLEGIPFPSGGIAPVSFVFQESRLLPWLTVFKNILLPMERILGREAAENRARFFLRLVSLEHKAEAYPEELSGGQKQRVSLARGFAYPAKLVLMDEPFQSLDIPLRVELMEMTRSLLEAEPRLAVMVTHDPREAIYLGRRIIVLGRRGIVLDEEITLSREERRYAAAGNRDLEARLLRALGGNLY
ncbi:MAG: ATP-binding cassette domain-containing protein [Treponema sp.]|jgi:NitT/TauT family transport system ATP-binding protein|nr:ATP-binding cassette domain-containing protein [Treponema sp.]